MQTITLLALMYFILGAFIGSFLGVCIYRIPMGRYEPTRDGIRELDKPVSILSPKRSFCPHCEKQLESWQLIPLVSWVLLRGRCYSCKAPIPFRYWLVEFLTASLCVLCLLRFGPTLTGLVAFLFISLLIVITFIDIDYMIIPDVITYPATALGICLGVANWALATPAGSLLSLPFVPSPIESLAGLIIGPGVLLALWWFYIKVRKKEGLGLGDVKLLAVLGAAFGPECAWFTIFFGSLLGTVGGVLSLLLQRKTLTSHIPFGPYLAAAATVFILDGVNLMTYIITPSYTIPWWIQQQI